MNDMVVTFQAQLDPRMTNPKKYLKSELEQMDILFRDFVDDLEGYGYCRAEMYVDGEVYTA